MSDIKEKPKCVNRYINKTVSFLNDSPLKQNVFVFSDGIIQIEKLVLTSIEDKEGLDYMVHVRDFKDKSLYKQVTTFRLPFLVNVVGKSISDLQNIGITLSEILK